MDLIKNYEFFIKIFKTKYLDNINSLNNYTDGRIVYKFNIDNYNNFMLNNYIKFLILYNNISISQSATYCTICKIHRNDQIINYSYIYGLLNNNNIINKYIITSNSLISKDGEYKYRLISINKLDLLTEKFNEIYNKIYTYISKNITNDEFELTFEVFNINPKYKKNYKKKLQNKQLLIKIYIISWLIENYHIYNNTQEINMNEYYNNIMFTQSDFDFFKELYNDYSKIINEFVITFSNYNNNINIGQKLIPFNYIQLKEYQHIIHPQWKEILINKISTNIRYNGISPCFSLFLNWFLIQKSNKDLYDNIEIYNKIFYSDKIKDILKYLYLAKNNFIELENKFESNKISESLLKQLKKLIAESENNVLMSNISMGYLSEYVGKTLYDYLIKLSKNTLNYNHQIGNIYNDYEIFSKYMFEIIYSLYCLNLNGIIHGDLHLNNITININNINLSNSSKIVYDLNFSYNDDILTYIDNIRNSNTKNINNFIKNINNCYKFNHYDAYPCIIDFSRSFILLSLIKDNIIEKEKNNIRDRFITIERNRIIKELNKLFPNYIKNNKHKIKFLFKNKNFHILFIYFSAYDVFTFATNMLIFYKRISINNNVNVNDKILNLLSNISKKAYSFLEKILDELNYDPLAKLQFPNLIILNEFFSEFKLTDTKEPIQDLYNLYNIDKFKTPDNIILDIQDYLKNLTNLNENESKSIQQDFNYILNYKKKSEEIEISKIINKEYYNIKSNLNIMSSSADDLSYNMSSNSFTLSDY
jgi:hypothetical protein